MMMRIEPVEIYSDATNAAIMRHPGRRFPGFLIQGDSLSVMKSLADDAYSRLSGIADEEALYALKRLKDALTGDLKHYATVLTEHGIQLPFVEPKKDA